MLELLCIAVILVFGIDLSGFVDEISIKIGKWMHPKVKYNGGRIPKPFGCETCLTFGVGLIYLLVTGTFSLYMALYVCLLSFLTPVIGSTLLFIKDGLIWLVNTLYKLIN